MVSLPSNLGSKVGSGRSSTKTPETRSYWEIAHQTAIQEIEKAIDWWSDDNRLMQKSTNLLANKPKGSNNFHISLKISNRCWSFDENNKENVWKVKTDPNNKNNDQVLPALEHLLQETKSITKDSKDGQNLIGVYKATKDRRWKDYAASKGMSDAQKKDQSEIDKWFASGAPNTQYDREKDAEKKKLHLLTTNPTF